MSICSYVKEAKKKADPYVAQALDAASRGLDFAKQKAIDLQEKVHLCTAEHLWHETNLTTPQVEERYPNLRKDAETAAHAFVSKFEEVMLKVWRTIIYAGEVTTKFAIDVKE